MRWENLTSRGGEGMVVKPLQFVARGKRGLVQSAAARNICASSTDPSTRRRTISPVSAIERFVRREPLRRVHECVFGVLALESEPVDPRL